MRTPKPPHLADRKRCLGPTIVTDINVQCGGQRFPENCIKLRKFRTTCVRSCSKKVHQPWCVNTFCSKYKLSCDGISSTRFDSRFNSSRLLSSIASRLWPAHSGAPNKITSAGLVSGRFMFCDVQSDRVPSERPMISHFLRFNSRSSYLVAASSCMKSFITHAALPPRVTSSSIQGRVLIVETPTVF